MPENPSTIEQDIADLERKLEEKKAVLEHEKSEKDILHGIIGEQVQKEIQASQTQLPTAQGPAPVQTESPSYLGQDIKDKVQEIVKIVFDKNLDEGIQAAAKTGNMALIDAFHDILTDELYNQLIEKRKLQKVN